MEELPGFLLAALALAGSPGPATLSVAGASAAFGVGRAAGYMVGLIVGMMGVIAVVVSGLTGLLFSLPGSAPLVGLVAAAYILYLAWRIATAPPLGEPAEDAAHPTFIGGVVLQVLNPKAYAAVGAIYSGFVLAADSHLLDLGAKTVAFMAVIVFVNVGWALAGSALRRVMSDPVASRAVNIAFAVLLVVSVVFAVLL